MTGRKCRIKKGFVLEDGLTHIHCYVFNYVVDDVQMKNLDTRQSQETDLSLLVTIPLLHREGPGVGPLIEILANAPRRIAAHHRFAAVGIEDTHRKVSLRHWRCSYQHQPVRTDTPMAVAPCNGSHRRVVNRVLHGIDVNIVVATAVHLCKPDFLCHTATFT